MTLSGVAGGSGVPPEPDWSQLYSDVLDIAVASDLWGVVTREMADAGTITVANAHAIRRLVDFKVAYERACREVAEHGAILKAKKTRVPQYNPYWIVMRQAEESMRATEAALGISPVHRSKAGKVDRAKKTPRAADRFLRSVPK